MLKKTRLIASLILFTLITLYFLDVRGLLPAQLQFLTEL